MSIRIFLFFTLFACYSLSAFSQKGTIRGTVIDDDLGETMIGVTVLVKGTSNGSVTDFDGQFAINVEPGTYDLQISFVSYETITISNVVVAPGEVVVFESIRLKESVEELQEVIITAQVIKTSEAAMLSVKKKSANLIDGISASSFKKIGDSDAGSAAKRVTGVTVEGGKYVYVRGLGDRYTKTTLNSVDIPGLDPDRNSLQIDLFPTNLLNNLIILKSATADLPADFTGGLVNIETKDFPEEKIFNVSLGLSYNPSMHFKSNALTYDGSNTDWLGFDTDLRQLPQGFGDNDLPQAFFDDNEEVYNASKQFSPVLSTTEKTNLMNYSLGASFGNQKNFNNGHSLGYIFSGTYKTDNEFYQDIQYGEYQRRNESDQFDFGAASTRRGATATENVLLGGLAGIAYKTHNSKFRFSTMRLQSGEKLAANLDIVSDPQEDDFDPQLVSNYIAHSSNLEYSQRSITNFLLAGEHHLVENKWIIDWRLSPTISSLTDPDIRRAAFSTEFGSNQINAGAAGSPSRIWRFLDETNYVGKVDITRNAKAFGSDAKFKAGLSYVAKEREYSITRFIATQTGTTFWADDATFDDIVADENLFPNGNRIYYMRDLVNPNPNAYQSSNTNLGAYVSAEVSLFPSFKTIVGLRMENFEQRHTGRDQQAARTINNGLENGQTMETMIKAVKADPALGNVLDNDVVLDNTNFFPSLNTIYSLSDNQNIRFSYSRTVARPSFKELSYAQILDPVSNRTFNGGFFQYRDENGEIVWDGNLRSTYIDNIDLRWELFMQRGELFSVSAFYKSFADPIELVRITFSQSGNEFQPRNVGNGMVAGAEFESRKSLDFLGQSFTKLSVYGNLTLVKSQINMTEPEFQSRLRYIKDGQTIEDTRVMAGQAPYVVNFGIQYNDDDKDLDAGLFYNVKGSTLIVVGQGISPDVFAQPFHSLNFNVNKSFGKTAVNMKISNILNDVRDEFFSGYQANDEIFTRRAPGTEISLGLSYAF